MAAIVFPVVLLFLAFVVDVAHAFVDQKHLQNTADAAALAGRSATANGGVSRLLRRLACLRDPIRRSQQRVRVGWWSAQTVAAPIHAYIASDPSVDARTATSGPTSTKTAIPTTTRYVVRLHELHVQRSSVASLGDHRSAHLCLRLVRRTQTPLLGQDVIHETSRVTPTPTVTLNDSVSTSRPVTTAARLAQLSSRSDTSCSAWLFIGGIKQFDR